MCCSWWHFC
jgi:hypothetical protein